MTLQPSHGQARANPWVPTHSSNRRDTGGLQVSQGPKLVLCSTCVKVTQNDDVSFILTVQSCVSSQKILHWLGGMISSPGYASGTRAHLYEPSQGPLV